MELLATEYDRQLGFELEWQSMDGSLVQAPVREKNSVAEGLGANLTDRGRSCDRGERSELKVTCPSRYIFEKKFQDTLRPSRKKSIMKITETRSIS